MDITTCNQCGLCIANCPAEAVFGINFPSSALNSLAEESKAPLILACHKQNSESEWSCLGFVDVKLLLALTYGGAGGMQTVVDDRNCSGCKKGIAAHLVSVVEEANAILTQEQRPLVRRGDAIATLKCKEKTISRRDFFGRLFGATVETVREIALPSTGRAERLPRQPLFRRRVRFSNQQPPLGHKAFSGIVIDSSCQACGMCAKFCPHNSITIHDKGAEIDIFHDPAQCTACNVCAVHCPVGAITITSAGRFDKHVVITAQLPKCENCGDLFQPINGQVVCLECMLKSRSQSIV